jgi:hypothetical protein
LISKILKDKPVQAQQRLDWLYWLDAYFSAYGNPAKVRGPLIIANLDALASAGIIQGKHLLELSHLSAAAPFEGQPQIKAILHTTNDAFIKVEQLLEWAKPMVDNKEIIL